MKKPQELFGPGDGDPDCPLCRAFAERAEELFEETWVEDGLLIQKIKYPEEILKLFRAMKGYPGAWTWVADDPPPEMQ